MNTFCGEQVETFLSASFSVQMQKIIMFFRLVAYSFKINLIIIFLFLITLFSAVKIKRISAYYLMLYLGLITTSALSLYPVPTLDKVLVIVQTRIVIFTIIPTILLVVFSINSIPEKFKLFRNIALSFVLIVVSYSNLVHGYTELERSFIDQEGAHTSFYKDSEFLKRSFVCMEAGIHTLHLVNNIIPKDVIVIDTYQKKIVGDRSKLDGCYLIIKDFSFNQTKKFLDSEGYKLKNVEEKNLLYYAVIKSK